MRFRSLLICLIFLPLEVIMAQSQEPEFNWVNPLPDGAHHRLKHEIFHSTVMDTKVGYNIYLPPGYEAKENQNKRYPVVYYLHGWRTGRETHAIYMAEYFHQWIESGAIPPRIYVFPHGGKLSHYDLGDSMGESAFITELIPHIDTSYRTIAKRVGRGLEGFSMGGRGTARDMFKYPELFCSAVPISGGHHREKRVSKVYGEGNDEEYLLPTNNSWDLADEYASRKLKSDISILVVVGTKDKNYEPNLEWMKHLEFLGIPFSRFVVPGVGHEAADLYKELDDQIMQFHEQCFSTAR